jgi:hypothetical protein
MYKRVRRARQMLHHTEEPHAHNTQHYTHKHTRIHYTTPILRCVQLAHTPLPHTHTRTHTQLYTLHTHALHHKHTLIHSHTHTHTHTQYTHPEVRPVGVREDLCLLLVHQVGAVRLCVCVSECVCVCVCERERECVCEW